ncbi:MAG: CRISPR system precrRNA processing endoribonuclease RAMP protein Cas6 [Chloroflexaceae bacterium]|jgi:hypothetical protein|nr:CRISPR system precrRNA processing endoribonuclease RAMP protein Cas6 [Chloroflexaceae bacterium]
MTQVEQGTSTDYVAPHLPFALMRARLTLRLLVPTTLPPYKGALLRGGFGYAFQRTCCPQPCWNHSHTCAVDALCPYRWVFETPHPPNVDHLHDLQDVPRPFVIEPPLDHKRQYAAGDTLEFGLTLIGRGIDFLPYFLFGFEQLGKMGLGRDNAPFRLERVEALRPWQTAGAVVYQDGRVTTGDRRPETGATPATPAGLPHYDGAVLAAQAAKLPADLRLTMQTPLRVKARGAFIERVDVPAMVQSIGWRLNALAAFHGDGPWDYDYRPLVEQARSVVVEQSQVQWVDWERTSTRGGQAQKMKLGGLIGSAVLRNVPVALRTLLLAGSLVHVGKAAVFGHGGIALTSHM